MRFRNVLVLAAHPDDEMGCSGTISRLISEGASVQLLTFSQCQDLNGRELLDEWREATELLGIRDPQLYDLPNRELPAHRQRVLKILDQQRGHGYDLVLTPASSDIHQDHATVSTEAARAFKHSTVLGYELPVNALVSHQTAFVWLGADHVERKVAHAALYRSQAGKPYMAESFIRGLLTVRGVQAGLQAAEAFEVVRWVL